MSAPLCAGGSGSGSARAARPTPAARAARRPRSRLPRLPGALLSLLPRPSSLLLNLRVFSGLGLSLLYIAPLGLPRHTHTRALTPADLDSELRLRKGQEKGGRTGPQTPRPAEGQQTAAGGPAPAGSQRGLTAPRRRLCSNFLPGRTRTTHRARGGPQGRPCRPVRRLGGVARRSSWLPPGSRSRARPKTLAAPGAGSVEVRPCGPPRSRSRFWGKCTQLWGLQPPGNSLLPTPTREPGPGGVPVRFRRRVPSRRRSESPPDAPWPARPVRPVGEMGVPATATVDCSVVASTSRSALGPRSRRIPRSPARPARSQPLPSPPPGGDLCREGAS